MEQRRSKALRTKIRTLKNQFSKKKKRKSLKSQYRTKKQNSVKKRLMLLSLKLRKKSKRMMKA